MSEKINIDFLFKNILKISPNTLSSLDVFEEFNALKLELNNKDLNKLKVIFTIEILIKIIKKKQDERILIDILLYILQKYNSCTFIIFRLRIIKNILSLNCYVPCFLILFNIFEQIDSFKEYSEGSMNYDSLNVKDQIDSLFVLQELRSLFLSNLNKISDCYGFVEVSNILLKEFKKHNKEIYSEFIEGICDKVNKHRNYIKECRNKNKKAEKMILI